MASYFDGDFRERRNISLGGKKPAGTFSDRNRAVWRAFRVRLAAKQALRTLWDSRWRSAGFSPFFSRALCFFFSPLADLPRLHSLIARLLSLPTPHSLWSAFPADSSWPFSLSRLVALTVSLLSSALYVAFLALSPLIVALKPA
ncbi:hypothetical protein HK096_004427 [Nowakowskiella sp. JEL0078]|nr:hypothetical protein HK096_004427 [Nowakowskiella sp. JEL0078]